MDYTQNNGIYNIGAKRFSVSGLYDEYASVYLWAFNEIDEHNKAVENGISGQFKTEKCPYVSEIFDKIMEEIRGGK